MIGTQQPIGHQSLAETTEEIDIAFRNLSYAVDHDEDRGFASWGSGSSKYLLNNVSGIMKAGQVTAIMGASGAGKTTLLNLLSCRLSDPPSGEITANGNPYDIDLFGRFANYVMQKDVLIPTLTVRQTLTFAADLKLNVSEEEKKDVVDNLSKKFGLQKCMDILVGGFLLKGISGGEKRRTFIAFEIISDSKVLVLDEPTSGLDSLTAYLMIKFLEQMAHQDKKTIFLTIHHPNSDIFDLFDRLILMLDGRFVYQGPAHEATNYFESRLGLLCPELSNPADYFIFVMSEAKERWQQQRLFEAYDCFIRPKINKQLEKESSTRVVACKLEISFWVQLKVLVGRDFFNFMRNPLMVGLRIVETIAVALFIGSIFYKFSGEYIEEVNWRALTGFLFFMSIAVSMINMAAVSFTFPNDRDVFLKEEGAKLYSTVAYFLSRNIIELPYAVVFPFFQSLIIYWFVNLSSTATQFFTFYLISYLLTLNGESLGLMVGSIASDVKSVTNIATMVFLPLFLFGGFFKNINTLPKWVGWIQYITPFKYGFAAFIQNEVLFASESRVGELNFDFGLWGNIGMLAVLALGFRVVSLVFLWALRSKLQ